MLDKPHKLQTYQTYIDGKWVDAASGKSSRRWTLTLESRGH